MMTQPLPIAGKLPIKLWLLSNYQQVRVCVYINLYAYGVVEEGW